MYAGHAPIDGAGFTFSVWSKRLDTGQDRCLVSQGPLSTDPGTRNLFHFCYQTSNRLRFGFWGDDLDSANTYTDTASFEYWVGTYDVSSNARALYRNGSLENSDTAGGSLNTTITDGSHPFEIGRRVRWWDYPWNGDLDEMERRSRRDAHLQRPALRRLGQGRVG
jgi:hypothetical protein